MFNFIAFVLLLLNPPEQITPNCLNTVYKIVQHESGNLQSQEAFRFMTEQIIQDLDYIPCNKLIQWRWKIGNYPLEKVTFPVKRAVLTVINRWPYREFPRCKFIGSPNDIKVWRRYGYNVQIGYSITRNNLTIIGVDCRPLRRAR